MVSNKGSSVFNRNLNRIEELLYTLKKDAETGSFLISNEEILKSLFDATRGKLNKEIIEEYILKSLDFHIFLSYLIYRIKTAPDSYEILRDLIYVKDFGIRLGGMFAKIKIKDFYLFLYSIVRLGLHVFETASNPFALTYLYIPLVVFGQSHLFRQLRRIKEALDNGDIDSAKIQLNKALKFFEELHNLLPMNVPSLSREKQYSDIRYVDPIFVPATLANLYEYTERNIGYYITKEVYSDKLKQLKEKILEEES